MKREKLDKILENHKLWLYDKGGECADLRGADLSGVDLSNANLRYINLNDANLYGADLSGADLSSANLSGADLYDADLRYINLSDVDLRNAKLYGVNLRGADLTNADLRNANLSDADLRNANLTKADLINVNLTGIKTNIYTIGYNLACPEEGSFIGYKKAEDCIIKLLILDDSKRSSATSIKCRCDKAKVLDIEKIDSGEKVKITTSSRDNDFIYKVGEIVKVDNFDENRWNECSTGIHFFMNKQNAIQY